MQNSQISFTSNIKFLKTSEFVFKTTGHPAKYNVGYPWTAKEIIKEPFALTRGIEDCTAGGITDGKDVVMFHLCPKKENENFKIIENALLEKIDLKSPYLQGFLLGSKSCFKGSKQLFSKLSNFMEKHKIPFSFFKGHNDTGLSNIAYFSKDDTWYISNNYLHYEDLNKTNIDKKLLKVFDEFSLCKEDEFVF